MSDSLGLSGVLQAWERPALLSVAKFMAIAHDQLEERLGAPVAEGHNMFVDNYYADAFTVMGGGAVVIGIPILCLGTGSMAGKPQRSDTSMVSEWNRMVLVASSVGSTDPIAGVFSFFAGAAMGAASITEAGLWYGGATITAGSGRMASHAAWTYSKSAIVDCRIDYSVTRTLT